MPVYRSSPLTAAILSLLLATIPSPSTAQQPPGTEAPPAIAEFTGDMERLDGYFPLHWDAGDGRLYLEVARLDQEFLYLPSLATGLGSARLLVDRGTVGSERIARFERYGDRVLLVLSNPRFRSTAESAALARSVRESFPTSTVAALPVVAETDGVPLVDATDHFLGDAFGVIGRLRAAEQGEFRVDRERSRIWRPRTRAFPDNTEIEAALTFVTERPGPEVRRHAPDGRAVTLRQHHSLVKLPDDGFRPRRFDPRVGLFPVGHLDYARTFDEGYEVRWAMRHRLRKRDPEAAMSAPVEPIVYYLDPAVPQPYRSAFVEGGMWWNDVFREAGFVDAFRIEEMPADMDPMDARYHVIQWVHRTEAGSSIGPSFVDPRSGEIIKAAVRMDSHRSLVDYDLYAGARPGMLAEAGAAGAAGILGEAALVDAAAPSPDAGWLAQLDDEVTAEEFVMARRRQHAAHEIGHTLGLAHNFIAASQGRASVMDYPAPLMRLVDGELDLSDAYAPGPGEYDELAIRWAYSELPEDEEGQRLEQIVREGRERGVEFVTNPLEGSWSSYPEATTWINGGDPVEELARVARVRRFLIERFDDRALDPGESLWALNRRFVPVYLHHRFTLQAAIKALGGMEFSYAVAGDPSPPTRIVEPERQRRALELLVAALQPAELAIPERLLELMAPRPFGHGPERRAFDSPAAPAFDQVGVARTLATMIVDGLLDRRRVARVVAFHERLPEAPSLEEVVASLVDGVFEVDGAGESAVARAVERSVADGLAGLAGDAEAGPEPRAAAEWGLRRILAILGRRTVASPGGEAHVAAVVADVQRFLERPAPSTPSTPAADPPPGTPIGDTGGQL